MQFILSQWILEVSHQRTPAMLRPACHWFNLRPVVLQSWQDSFSFWSWVISTILCISYLSLSWINIFLLHGKAAWSRCSSPQRWQWVGILSHPTDKSVHVLPSNEMVGPHKDLSESRGVSGSAPSIPFTGWKLSLEKGHGHGEVPLPPHQWLRAVPFRWEPSTANASKTGECTLQACWDGLEDSEGVWVRCTDRLPNTEARKSLSADTGTQGQPAMMALLWGHSRACPSASQSCWKWLDSDSLRLRAFSCIPNTLQETSKADFPLYFMVVSPQGSAWEQMLRLWGWTQRGPKGPPLRNPGPLRLSGQSNAQRERAHPQGSQTTSGGHPWGSQLRLGASHLPAVFRDFQSALMKLLLPKPWMLLPMLLLLFCSWHLRVVLVERAVKPFLCLLFWARSTPGTFCQMTLGWATRNCIFMEFKNPPVLAISRGSISQTLSPRGLK